LTKEEEAGRVQCHRYWAQCSKTPCVFGSFNLSLLSETTPFNTATGTTDNSIIVRKFSLQNFNLPNEPAHEIIQLHFLGWPDFGIPESPCQILKLIDAANEVQSQAAATCQNVGPMVVHCSAGCGRTGAFCTIDSVLSILKNLNGDVGKSDIVQSTVASFREQRLSMVQTLRQYVFCYEAVLWKFIGAA
jgi:protein tyrosine phosphatase